MCDASAGWLVQLCGVATVATTPWPTLSRVSDFSATQKGLVNIVSALCSPTRKMEGGSEATPAKKCGKVRRSLACFGACSGAQACFHDNQQLKSGRCA